MSKTFRKAAMSTICMLIVAVMSLTGATYAWFTIGDTATVDGMKMEIVAAAGGLEVSTDGNVWGNALSLTNQSKSSINPVSTVDAENFVGLKEYNPADSEQIKVTSVNAADNVITQTLKLRNTGTESITIDFRNTYIRDIANATGNKTTDIGKAGRIAIFVKSGENWALKGIMAPYYDETVTDGNKYACDTTAYKGIKLLAQETESADYFYFRVNGTNQPDANRTSDVTLYDTDATAMELTIPGLVNNVAQVIDIKVVVWLEGQDADCSNPNAGGAFDVVLQFNKTGATITDLNATN